MPSMTQVMDVSWMVMNCLYAPIQYRQSVVIQIITLLDLEDDHSDSSRGKENDNAFITATEEKEIIFLTQLHDFSYNITIKIISYVAISYIKYLIM